MSVFSVGVGCPWRWVSLVLGVAGVGCRWCWVLLVLGVAGVSLYEVRMLFDDETVISGTQ